MAVSYVGPGFTQVSITVIKRDSILKRAAFSVYRYFMRARNSLGQLVLWVADYVDRNGAESTDVNKPFTDPVILSVRK